MLHSATLADLAVIPGLNLEKLKGNRRKEHSIRINKQYRVCFIWERGDAYAVAIEKHYE
jgi:proteic killer suppression protein